ncbi:MAG: hypothetical protein QXL94_01710 [Candidatus Parvarchaeum sp.]
MSNKMTNNELKELMELYANEKYICMHCLSHISKCDECGKEFVISENGKMKEIICFKIDYEAEIYSHYCSERCFLNAMNKERLLAITSIRLKMESDETIEEVRTKNEFLMRKLAHTID